MPEFRTVYKGRSERPWLRVGFEDRSGYREEFDLVADTGSPMAVLLRPDFFRRFEVFQAPPEHTSFGFLETGWFRMVIPSLGLQRSVHCFSCQIAADIVSRSHTDFAGVIGLPILRLGEYGGDASEFWFRYPK